MLCYTIIYYTVQYNTIQYNTILCYRVPMGVLDVGGCAAAAGNRSSTMHKSRNMNTCVGFMDTCVERERERER